MQPNGLPGRGRLLGGFRNPAAAPIAADSCGRICPSLGHGGSPMDPLHKPLKLQKGLLEPLWTTATNTIHHLGLSFYHSRFGSQFFGVGSVQRLQKFWQGWDSGNLPYRSLQPGGPLPPRRSMEKSFLPGFPRAERPVAITGLVDCPRGNAYSFRQCADFLQG